MLTLLRQSIADFHHTGTVWPSSRYLARAMTRAAREQPGAKRILEVGPGSGVFTRRLLSLLGPDDELHVVEINPVLAERLERTVLAPWRAAHPGVRVVLHQAAIQDADVDGPFDHVVCGLPFNNFPTSLVRSLFRRMLSMLGRGGVLTFYEYAGVRAIRSPFSPRQSRQRLRSLGSVLRMLRRRHAGRRTLVVANIPPAFATRLSASERH